MIQPFLRGSEAVFLLEGLQGRVIVGPHPLLAEARREVQGQDDSDPQSELDTSRLKLPGRAHGTPRNKKAVSSRNRAARAGPECAPGLRDAGSGMQDES